MSLEELLCKISEITKSNYAFNNFDYAEMFGVLMIASEELLNHYIESRAELESIKNDIEENYKPITREEQIYG